MFSIISLKDSKRPFLGPNYWILKKMGLLLPTDKAGKIMYILMHEIGTLFVASQFVELYVVKSDIDMVLNNMKISMLSFICIVKANTFIFWQSSWREVLRYVTEADNFERSDSDLVNDHIIVAYTKYSRKVTYSYWFLVVTTCLMTVFTPVMKFSPTKTYYSDNFHNGTETFPHIFSSWMPFDKNLSPGSWITVLWHTLICAYGGGVVLAYDSSIIAIMVFFGGKLDLLRERCKQIFRRGEFEITNDEFRSVVHQIHQIHVLLMKYSRLFNSLLSPVMFFYTVVCSFMICATAFQLTTTTNATQKLLTAEYLIFGIAQLFIFCWHSNDVLIKNENVTLGPYESNWWMGNPSQRITVHNLLGQLRNKNVFTAGPFADLTLSTFITILKGAYSYYTLLRE